MAFDYKENKLTYDIHNEGNRNLLFEFQSNEQLEVDMFAEDI